MFHTFRLRFVLSACFLTTLLTAPAAMAQPDECKGEAVKIVKVTISGEAYDIKVDPETVEIERHGRVCWEIDGLAEGHTLTMSGKSEADDHFADHSVTLPRKFMNSGAPNKPGTFHYDLTLSADGNEISKLDPAVVIGPGG